VSEYLVLARRQLREKKVPAGALVESLTPNGPAARFGIRVGDLITAIGTTVVTDIDTYARARDFYAQKAESAPAVAITLWRSGELLKIEGIITFPFGATVREYSFFVDSVLHSLEQGDSGAATKLLEQAKQEGLLTRKNLLLLTLLVAPDSTLDDRNPNRAAAEELRDLLRPTFDLTDVWLKFKDHQHANAGAFVLEKFARERPNDVSLQLNFGLTIVRLKRNDEAEEIAKRLTSDPGYNLSGYGRYVAGWILSEAAENRAKWKEAYRELLAGIQVYKVRSNDDAVRVAFLAAKQLDEDLFKETRSVAESIRETPEVDPYLDSLEAYVLTVNNRTDEARRLVSRWTSDDAIWKKIHDHWQGQFPEVAKNWDAMRRQ
jgi:hypothetical protein